MRASPGAPIQPRAMCQLSMLLLATMLASTVVASVTPAPAAGIPPVVVLGWTPSTTQGVPLNGRLTVYFNQAMDWPSVVRAWRLSPSVHGAFLFAGTSVSFTPSRPLRPGSSYTLTLDPAARALNGATLRRTFSIAFSTGDALGVRSFTPFPGTGAVSLYGLIAVTFTHPMVSLVGLSASIGNPRGWHMSILPRTPGYGTWLGTSTWVFHPSGGLRPSAQYNVTLRGSVRDASGQYLGHDLHWSFRTVGPEIVDESPGNGTQFVSPQATVRVTFNQPMDRTSTAHAFSVRAGPASIRGRLSWQGTTLVFHPVLALDSSKTYVVEVSRSARSANGQAALRRSVMWRFHAAPLPEVVATEPDQGGTTYGTGCVTSIQPYGCRVYIPASQGDTYAVDMDFNTPMSKVSLDRHLTIHPSISRLDTYLWGPTDTQLFPYGISGNFHPSTSYTVTIGPGAHDRFGRSLAPVVFHFKTAQVVPSVALYGMPGQGEGISYSAGRVVDAPVQVINVPSVRYTLKRVTLQALAAWQSGQYSGGPVYPAGHTVRKWTEGVPHPLNKVENIGAHLAQKDGSPLPAGLYWLGAEGPGDLAGVPPGSPAPSSSEIIAVTNVSLTIKTGSNGTLVWAASAQNGEPLSGLHLQLVDYAGSPVDNGATDARGMHFFHRSFPQGPPGAIVDDKVYFGLAKSYWQPPVPSTITQPSTATSPFPFNRGPFVPYAYSPAGTFLYTDRPVYRPGQVVHFRAVLWRDNDGVYGLLGEKSAMVQINDARGRLLYHAQVKLDRFGTARGSVLLPRNTPTGYDFMSISVPKLMGVNGNFLVANYRKPEFLATVTSDRVRYVQGQTATVSATVKYVFGAPVIHQRVDWVAYTQPQYTSPPGWDDYAFFDWTTYWEQTAPWWQPSPPEQSQFGNTVAHGTGLTDGRGRLRVRLPVNLTKASLDQDVTIEATATDVNNQVVSARVQVPEYKAAFALGLKTQQQVVPAGQEETVDVAAVRPDGSPVQRQSVTASIYQRTYTSRLARSAPGQPQWQAVPHDTLVEAQKVLTDAKGIAALSFTPKVGGEYRVVVASTDELGNHIHNGTSIFASAEGFSDWGISSNTVITLTPDKASYSVGDTAHLLVAAPFDHATALVTLERNSIRMERVQHLKSNSSKISIPIKIDDIPNVFVTVTVYRGWRNGSPPDWRYGVADLHVRLDPRHIVVHLAQSGSHHHPGDRVTYTVTTTDMRGRPVSAQLSLALVDTAVLALQVDSNPDILKAFYSERALGVSTSSDGVLSIDHLAQKPDFQIQPIGGINHGAALSVPKAAAPQAGGGGGGYGPPITVRSRFADTAYWSAAVVTDSSGRATLHLKLPDNATTWRLDAPALTPEGSVGQAQLRTQCSQDIILRPVVPRFLVQGDVLQVGTVVNNTLRRQVGVTVSIGASGLAVAGRPLEHVSVPARGERLLLWKVRVPITTAARIMLRAVPSTPGVQGDATSVTLPVHPPLTDETVATAGQVFGSVKQLVILPRNAVTQPGALTVQLSASITAGLGAAYRELQPSPYESNDDVADRVLAAGALRSLPVSLAGLSPSTWKRLPLDIAAGVQKLLDHQLGDGGWPWFNDPWAISDPLITADAVQALSASGQHGPLVRSAMQHGRAYLRSQLATVSPGNRAHLLLVLALSGKGSHHATEALYNNSVVRSHLSVASLADLLQSLNRTHDSVKARSIVSALDGSSVVSATGAHWEGDVEGGIWDFYARPAVSTTTAALWALVSLSPHDPFVPAAARRPGR